MKITQEQIERGLRIKAEAEVERLRAAVAKLEDERRFWAGGDTMARLKAEDRAKEIERLRARLIKAEDDIVRLQADNRALVAKATRFHDSAQTEVGRLRARLTEECDKHFITRKEKREAENQLNELRAEVERLREEVRLNRGAAEKHYAESERLRAELLSSAPPYYRHWQEAVKRAEQAEARLAKVVEALDQIQKHAADHSTGAHVGCLGWTENAARAALTAAQRGV